MLSPIIGSLTLIFKTIMLDYDDELLIANFVVKEKEEKLSLI